MTRKTFRKKDPYLGREKKKYERPVPSREYILDLLEKSSQPLMRDYFVRYFKLDEGEEEGIRRRLNAMVRDGQITRTRKGYIKTQVHQTITGRLSIGRDGMGRILHEGLMVWVSLNRQSLVFEGDEVSIHLTGHDRFGRATGRLHEVITPVEPACIASLIKEDGQWLARPLDKKVGRDILLETADAADYQLDQVVSVLITRDKIIADAPHYPGCIQEVLGEPDTPGIEIEIAKRKFDLRYTWPEGVTRACQRLPKKVPPAAMKGRKDLRALNFVTIDGADAKDFDDAVYCEKRKPGGWRLYVAIADVSHYVKPRSNLDKEAAERATSVYFPGHVIPMLPEALSNELCSLKPNVDRLAVVCELCLQADGTVTRTKFYEAVFRSKARLTYQQVGQFLDKEHTAEVIKPFKQDLNHLNQVYKALLKQRKKRGAIDFEVSESQLLFNRDGKIKKIVPLVRNEAHRLIEECMLAANVAAAKFLLKHKQPAPYRVHESPPHDKLITLREYLGEFGLSLGKKQSLPTAQDFQKVLKQIHGREDAHILQTVMLRSLSQARYTTDNIGHFGLAYDAYLHFTSPIRRYPDLLVHRAIKKVLAEKATAPSKQLEETAAHCSAMERQADDASRDVITSLKCQYMAGKVGEVFDGVISSIVPFGLFVDLPTLHIEGLVHVTALGQDYFIHDPKRHRMVGDRTGVTYKLGDKVKIRVARVGVDDQKIDFTLLNAETTKKQSKSSKAKKKKMKAGKLKKRKGRQSACRKKKS